MEQIARPFTVTANHHWLKYRDLITRTGDPSVSDIDLENLIPLLPDEIEEHYISIEKKIQLLRQQFCYLQPGEHLTLTPINGTLRIISSAAMDFSERLVTEDTCRMNIYPATVLEAVFRMELPNNWYGGPAKTRFEDALFDKMPDFISGNPIAIMHKRGLLQCKVQQIAPDIWLKLDPLTKTLWWSRDQTPDTRWLLIHNHQVEFGPRLKMKELDAPEKVQPTGISTQVVFDHLKMKRQGRGDHFPWIYDIEYILQLLPDKVCGYSVSPSEKAMLLITGETRIEADVYLKIDTHNDCFLLVQPEDGPFKYNIASPVAKSQCQYDPQPLPKFEKMFRYPVGDQEFQLAYSTWNPDSPDNSISPKVLQKLLNRLPDRVLNDDLNDLAKTKILFSRTPVQLLGGRYSLDYHSGLLLVYQDPFSVAPVRQMSCYNSFYTSQTLSKEINKTNPKHQGLER